MRAECCDSSVKSGLFDVKPLLSDDKNGVLIVPVLLESLLQGKVAITLKSGNFFLIACLKALVNNEPSIRLVFCHCVPLSVPLRPVRP